MTVGGLRLQHVSPKQPLHSGFSRLWRGGAARYHLSSHRGAALSGHVTPSITMEAGLGAGCNVPLLGIAGPACHLDSFTSPPALNTGNSACKFDTLGGASWWNQSGGFRIPWLLCSPAARLLHLAACVQSYPHLPASPSSHRWCIASVASASCLTAAEVIWLRPSSQSRDSHQGGRITA